MVDEVVSRGEEAPERKQTEMELKTKVMLAMVTTLLVVGAAVVSKAASAFQEYQSAQTAQIAGF